MANNLKWPKMAYLGEGWVLLQRVRLTGTTVKFGVEDTVIGEAVEEQVPQLEDDLAFYPGEMLLLEDIRDEWVWGRVMDQQQFDPATWANIVQAQQIKDYPANHPKWLPHPLS